MQSDSEETQIVEPTKSWLDDTRQLPNSVNHENVCEAVEIIVNSVHKSAMGIYLVGSYLLDNEVDLDKLIIRTGLSISSLERWKGFTKKCRRQKYTIPDILEHGGTYSAISKALKGPNEPKNKPKKPKCSLDDIDDLKELRAEARRKITEAAKLAQTQVRAKLKAKHEKELEAKDKTIEDLKAQIQVLKKGEEKKSPPVPSINDKADFYRRQANANK